MDISRSEAKGFIPYKLYAQMTRIHYLRTFSVKKSSHFEIAKLNFLTLKKKSAGLKLVEERIIDQKGKKSSFKVF